MSWAKCWLRAPALQWSRSPTTLAARTSTRGLRATATAVGLVAPARLPSGLRVGITFVIVLITWVFFRAESLGQAEPEVPNDYFALGQAPEDLALIIYTSGTTGQPKGCQLDQVYFLAAGDWYAGLSAPFDLRPGLEVMLTPLPMFHMTALAYSVMAMITTGGTLVPLDRFHPDGWTKAMRDSQATIVHYLGVMPSILMKRPADDGDRAHQVRFGFGAGVDRKLHADFENSMKYGL